MLVFTVDRYNYHSPGAETLMSIIIILLQFPQNALAKNVLTIGVATAQCQALLVFCLSFGKLVWQLHEERRTVIGGTSSVTPAVS